MGKENAIVMTSIIALVATGCNNESPEVSDIGITVEALLDASNSDEAENIAAVYRDIYDEAVEANTLFITRMKREYALLPTEMETITL